MSKETIDGDMAYMEQTRPKYTDIRLGSQTGRSVLHSLGVGSNAVKDSGLSVVNTGNAFLIVPLVDENHVRNLSADMSRIGKISETSDLIGYYVFSPDVRNSGRHAGARMFALRYGIEEGSATGIAASPLACY